MSIRIGLYDFFAYTIPGGFYLLTLGYLLISYTKWTINFQVLGDFTTLIAFLLITIAYLTGILLDMFARHWQSFFTSRNTEDIELEKFKTKYSHLNVKIKSTDGALIRAYLKKTDTDGASAIEKNGATRTMLRNISLNFIFLAIIFLVQSFSFINWQLTTTLCLISIALSITAGKQCARYHEWFYILTYECAVASSLKPGDFAEKRKKNSERKNAAVRK